MATCAYCKGYFYEHGREGLSMCEGCGTKVGVIPMPPASRPPTPCARCSGRKFVRCIPREHTSATGGEMNEQHTNPMFLTHAAEAHHGWILNHVKELDARKGFGMLEVYACWNCGAVEWHCLDVRNIPIHPDLMTQLIDYDDTESPYR